MTPKKRKKAQHVSACVSVSTSEGGSAPPTSSLPLFFCAFLPISWKRK